jgi:hypothetical protein
MTECGRFWRILGCNPETLRKHNRFTFLKKCSHIKKKWSILVKRESEDKSFGKIRA